MSHEYSQVKLLTNPNKTIFFQGSFTNHDQTEFVSYYDRHIGIDHGVWLVTVSDVLIKNNLNANLNVIFDISTNLVHTLVNDKDQGLTRFVTKEQTLHTFGVKLMPKNAPDQKDCAYSVNGQLLFFTVEGHWNTGFTCTIKPRPLMSQTVYNIKAEVTFLFQRMK